MKCTSTSLTIICMAAVLVYINTGCSETRDPTQGMENRKIPVQCAPVLTGTITAHLKVSGTIQPLEQAKVGSKVEGTISSILVDEGDTVEKGQVLVRLDSRDFLLDIDRTKAAAGVAGAELEKATHDLERQTKDWERISRLYERRVIAKHRYDSMKASYSMARAKVKEAGALLDQRNAECALSRKRYHDSIVRAPFDGVVTKKLLHEGEVSSLWAYNWETLEIMDLSSVKIECSLSEKYKARITTGMDARVGVDAFPGKTFSGKITTVTPRVNPRHRTFRVKIVIPNPDLLLTAGMFARVKITLETRRGVPVIPLQEVIEQPDGNYIFTVDNGIAKKRKIALGIREGDRVEITEGLTAGEIIVVAGSHRLQDGYAVEQTRGAGD